MRVNVCIPHYVRESVAAEDNPNGYGSLSEGATLKRTIALSRCIGSLLNLQRSQTSAVLNIGQQRIDHISNKQFPIELNIIVMSDGENQLTDALRLFGTMIRVEEISIEDPRHLALACRDHLIKNTDEAELYVYMEDDLIIHDGDFFEKQAWFIEKTNHQFCLMPHRYERIDMGGIDRMLVDGPLIEEYINSFTNPVINAAEGNYRGRKKISFDITNNPHSGMFVISNRQAKQLRELQLPRSGFNGPLETAATLTVLQSFKVMKPGFSNYDFLCIEHGHPSFQNYIHQFPHKNGAGEHK